MLNHCKNINLRICSLLLILLWMGFLFSKLAGYSQFENESLSEHNKFRAKHGCPPLKLNKNLCNFAMEWAEKLSKADKVFHRPDNKYGENIYWAYNVDVNGKVVVSSWYNEVENYSFERSEFSPNTGHFTQVVWKDTKEMGIAIKKKGKTSWVVANYDPPGNYRGRFKENVLPAK